VTRSVTLTLHNDLAEISRMLDGFEAFAACNHIPTAAVSEIALALDEVVSNVINYAWMDEFRHEFILSLSVDEDCLTATLVDDGMAYDPSMRAPVSLPDDLDDWTVGGLGIYLARTVIDRLEYRREDGFNKLTLFKNLTNLNNPSAAGARPR
jgi:anti-sigma regulatory factor (Ser/Thr protein kinase)